MRSLKRKGNAKKVEDLPASEPFSFNLAKLRWHWQERLAVAERFMPLNSRSRGLTKSVKAFQGIIDVFFILQKSEKGIISKMTIDQLGR